MNPSASRAHFSSVTRLNRGSSARELFSRSGREHSDPISNLEVGPGFQEKVWQSVAEVRWM